MATGWLSSGEVILDADGKIIVCDTCPCGTTGLCLLWNDNTWYASDASPGTYWDDVSQKFGLAGITTHGAIATPGYLTGWTGNLADYSLVVWPGPTSDASWLADLYFGSGTGSGATWTGRIYLSTGGWGLGAGVLASWYYIESLFGVTGLTLDWTEASAWPPYGEICGLPFGITGMIPASGTPAHTLTDGVPELTFGLTPAQNCATFPIGGNNVYISPWPAYSHLSHIRQNAVDTVDWVLGGSDNILRYGQTGFHYNLMHAAVVP